MLFLRIPLRGSEFQHFADWGQFLYKATQFLSGAQSHSMAGSLSRSGHCFSGLLSDLGATGHQGWPDACPQRPSCRLAPGVMTMLQHWSWVRDRRCPPILSPHHPDAPHLGTVPVPSGVQAPLGGRLRPIWLTAQPLLPRCAFSVS